jgi:predicted nucleotidyltransferase
MTDTELDSAVVDELRRTHAIHTAIVYGSRARDDATPESDLDVAAFGDVERTLRDARVWNGLVLDAFVYPTAIVDALDADMLKLRGGRIILDERGLAASLLAKLDELHRAGPPAITEDDAQMRRTWAEKMLARIQRSDLESHYRRHWLLYQLLEDYYALRRLWYRGPKESFAELAIRDPDTHAAFARALPSEATHDALVALVAQVTGA